jgi:septal ring factor EnvC (AmiA/AmiB activator)
MTFIADSTAASGIERELAALEQKLAALLAHTRELRAANAALRDDIAMVEAENLALETRVDEARRRLDALLARLPAE